MRKIFVMLLTISQMLTFLTSCSSDVFNPAPVVSKSVELPSFSAISTESAVNVILKEGAQQSVKVNGYETLIDDVDLEVVDGLLKVGFNNGGATVSDFKLEVEIVLPEVDQLKTNGPGNITVEGFSNLDDLLIEVKGSGNVHCNAPINLTQKLDVLIDGSGSVLLDGTTELLEVKVNGAGSIRAFTLDAQVAKVDVLASGTTELLVQNTLDVVINGSGHVRYKGTPNINKQITGSGQLIDAN